MRTYILRRISLAIFVVWVISILTFSLVRLIPGDVVDSLLAEQGVAYEKTKERLRHEMGLDRPFLVQYLTWMGNAFQGDLGRSLWRGGSVVSNLKATIPVSLELGLFALIIALVIAIPVGILSAIRQDGPLDYGSRFVTILGLAAPEFWIATMILIYGSLWFRYSPPVSYQRLWEDPVANLMQILFPMLILGYRLSCTTARMLRSTMLEVLRQDYIRTAWAKGLRERVVITQHAVRNALIPVVTIIGGQVPLILGGTVILETIFGLPGMGRLTFTSVQQRDYTQLQGNVLVMATFIVFVNLVVDISYAWLDPRIQYR